MQSNRHDPADLRRVRQRLPNEYVLRAAAAMLLESPDGEVGSTTVVGALPTDPENLHAFRSRIRVLAQEYGLEADATFHRGSFSVRFRRPTRARV